MTALKVRSPCRGSGLHYSERDSWDPMLQSGVQSRDRFTPETIFSFLRTVLSSPATTLECARLRSQGGHKPYFEIVDPAHSLMVAMVRKPRPARALRLVPGGGVEPPRY